MSALFLSKRDSAISIVAGTFVPQVASISCCIWSLELPLPGLDPLGKDSKAFRVTSRSILRDDDIRGTLRKTDYT